MSRTNYPYFTEPRDFEVARVFSPPALRDAHSCKSSVTRAGGIPVPQLDNQFAKLCGIHQVNLYTTARTLRNRS